MVSKIIRNQGRQNSMVFCLIMRGFFKNRVGKMINFIPIQVRN